LCFVLFVVLGAVGIAIATSLAGWINVVLLVTELKRRAEFALDAEFRRAFAGIVAASAAMGAVLWWLTSALTPGFAPERGLLVQVAALLSLVAGGLLTYLAVGTLFGALKPRTLLKDLLGR
jgi:putative peptidoglycan lipid II flippase